MPALCLMYYRSSVTAFDALGKWLLLGTGCRLSVQHHLNTQADDASGVGTGEAGGVHRGHLRGSGRGTRCQRGVHFVTHGRGGSGSPRGVNYCTWWPHCTVLWTQAKCSGLMHAVWKTGGAASRHACKDASCSSRSISSCLPYPVLFRWCEASIWGIVRMPGACVGSVMVVA